MFNMKKIFKISIYIILIMLLSNKYYTNGFDETKVAVTNNETSEADIIENDDDECIASLSEVKNKKSESENYGDTDAWMYWYLTDSDTVLHLTSIYDENYYAVSCGANDEISYGTHSMVAIKKVVFDNEIRAVTCNKMFYMFEDMEEIENLNYLNTQDVTNMSYMFVDCQNLEKIDVSHFDTSKVTTFKCFMGEMYYIGCPKITSIDVSGFDTSNVIDFSFMFYGCSGLTDINVSGFDTSNAIDYSFMFYGCSGLTNINVSGFDTRNATNFSNMFYRCSGLTDINVSGFDTSNVIDFSFMFYGCSGLTDINVCDFDTSNATNLSNMFYNCQNLKSITLNQLNTNKVTDFSGMFSGCSSLTSLDVSSLNTSNATNLYSMFSGCGSLTSLDVSNLNTSKATILSSMFNGCYNLISLDLSNFNTSNVLSMVDMFAGCSNLKTIYVSDLFVTNSIDLAESGYETQVFTSCTSLIGGNGTIFDDSKIDYNYACIDTPKSPGYFTSIDDYIEPDVSSISIKTNPNKMNYKVGEKFNPYGLILKVIYEDGTTKNIKYDDRNKNKFSFEPNLDTDLKIADNDIIINYKNSNTVLNVIIEENDNKDPSSGGGGKNNNSQSNKNNNGSSSGGSGGGGGGGSLDLLPQNYNQIIDVHRISYDKTISKTIDILKCRWVKDLLVNKWQLFFEDGSKAINGFYIINNIKFIDANNVKTPVVVQDTYYFDANGYMITGWLQTKDEKWYFFDISENEDLGKMIVGWREVQGSYYYFNQDGTMMTNGITTDGYTIGADGKWVR